MSKSNILFAITGSIASYKALGTVSALIKEGHNVQCVGTKSALQFIGPASVEGLTGRPFITDIFAPGNMMDHIHLARWANVFVIAPATANTLAKLNLGIADDLVSTLFCALEKNVPVLIAPAMNPEMWNHSRTKSHVEDLKNLGCKFLEPEVGPTACGETGTGRMVEAEVLTAKILDLHNTRVANKPSFSRGRVLITSGGTSEAIDRVRRITNSSTGRTGAEIADYLSEQNYSVHLLAATTAVLPKNSNVQITRFENFEELQTKLKHSLGAQDFDFVIHAAAVSDYSVDKVLVDQIPTKNDEFNKLDSGKSINVQLKPNPKIIDQIKVWSKNKNVRLIGFKLTDNPNIDVQLSKVNSLFEHSNADIVVHNDLSNINGDNHLFNVFDKSGIKFSASNRSELAIKIEHDLMIDQKNNLTNHVGGAL